mgnify:CR=1 FL=1
MKNTTEEDETETSEEMVAVITRLPKSLRDSMREICAEEERSLAATIRMLCTQYVAGRAS